MSEPVIRAREICKSYPSGGRRLEVLRALSLEVGKGEMVAVVGESGAGKSTLLHLLGGLDRPDSGSILLAGRELSRLDAAEAAALRNREVGYVFQFHHLLPEFSAEENVLLPCLIRRDPPGSRGAGRCPSSRSWGSRGGRSTGSGSSPGASSRGSPWPGPSSGDRRSC